jgi:PAS domain S-box-containing protein
MVPFNIPQVSSFEFPQNENLYGLLFQNSLDGLMLTAPDGSILDANPAACRILGRTREESEGHQGLMDSSDPRLAVLV